MTFPSSPQIKRLAQVSDAEHAADLLGRMAEQIAARVPPELRAYLRAEPEFHFHHEKYRLQLPLGLVAIKYIHQVTPGDTYAGHLRRIVWGTYWCSKVAISRCTCCR